MAVQAHAEEIDFIFFKDTFGWLKEQVIFMEDLKEF
jgi:hypothetical protein